MNVRRIRHLLSASSSSRLDQRLRAIEELSALLQRTKQATGRGLYLTILRSGLLDRSWLVRNACAEVFGIFGDRRDVFAIRVLLKDPSDIVRCTSIVTLEQLVGKRVLNDALSLLDDPSPLVQAYAGMTLQGHLGKHDAQLLKSRLSSFQGPAKFQVAYAICLAGDCEPLHVQLKEDPIDSEDGVFHVAGILLDYLESYPRARTSVGRSWVERALKQPKMSQAARQQVERVAETLAMASDQ